MINGIKTLLRWSAIISMQFVVALNEGFAGSTEDLEAVLRSKLCQPNMATYANVTYKEHCGDAYMTTMSLIEAAKCQAEVDKLNSTINRYNLFVSNCRGTYQKSYR